MRDAAGPSEQQGAIGWMARNPIAANLAMGILLVGGFWSALAVQKEVFPEFQLDTVAIEVGYPGAAPSEVEQGILLPIEEAVKSVEGIREVTSSAREGTGTLSIELVAGADLMRVYQDVDQAVSRIRTFPDDIEQPEVRIGSQQREVLGVILYGDVDRWTLRKLGEQLRDQLRSNAAITQVEIRNAPDYVTHVEIPRDTLRQYGLTLGDVARTIAASSEDVAAGSVEASTGEVLLRVAERKQVGAQFARIEVLTSAEGSSITLADIATLRDGFEEAGYPSRFDDRPSVQLQIFRVGDQSPIDIADAVAIEMEGFESRLPPGVEWRITSNSAEDFRQRVGLVANNGLMAIVIVLAILALFLELRLAFWVMMGMVISFFGGLFFLPAIDLSVNMISLFGFLIVLGIVVDDAIVVGENVFEKRRSEKRRLDAAIAGAREVAAPVVFSILSNVVAFVPLLFIPGTTGKFWRPLPFVVIVVLIVSLLEALFILPAHLAHARQARPRNRVGRALHGLQVRFSSAFTRFVRTRYAPLLDRALEHRYVTLTGAVALFVIAVSYATSAHMGLILMPEVSADEIEAGVRLPVGTTPGQAAAVAGEVTRATLRMVEDHGLETTAEGVLTNVRGGARFVDVEIVMRPPDERELDTAEVIDLWRQEIGDLPGVTQITFEAEAGPGGHRPDISIDISHADVEVLEKATAALVARAHRFRNTRDVSDDYDKGKEQLDVQVLPEGRALGLTAESVGRQLRGAFFGELALRLLRGTDEVEVRVKLPKAERRDFHALEDLVIRTPSGAEVPLLDVVSIDRGEAFSSIARRDGRRVVSVSMDVEPKRAIGQVIETFQREELPRLRADFPGLTWTFEGSDAEMREATGSLWAGFAFAMAIIYALLAIAFRSYLQPFVVLSAIPFGIIGAVFGHVVLGYDLSLVSLMGVIALSGIVVNDSLIMVEFANRRCRKGASARDAIHYAGLRRFRPIVLTTLTTFGGLTPIILEPSLQAQYIIPMAISLGAGVVFSTGIILLLVPALYLLLEDLQGQPRRGRTPGPGAGGYRAQGPRDRSPTLCRRPV